MIVLQLSTLKYSTSPADMLVVHPVNVLSVDFVADVIVGFADAQILSATVGG